MLSPEFAAQVQAMFEEDLSHSQSLDLASWRRRPWGERVLATLGRLIERHQ